MAKVLTDLPAGMVIETGATSILPKASSGHAKTTRQSMKGSARGSSSGPLEAPKALRRGANKSGGWLNSVEGMEWQARRCEAFGIAASRYFHKRDRPAGALRKNDS